MDKTRKAVIFEKIANQRVVFQYLLCECGYVCVRVLWIARTTTHDYHNKRLDRHLQRASPCGHERVALEPHASLAPPLVPTAAAAVALVVAVVVVAVNTNQ